MRLINADDLKKTLHKWHIDNRSEDFTGDEACEEFYYMIDNEDTVETSPLTHAHWIEFRANSGNVRYKCSHCGKEVSYPYTKKRWKYCIECGARMDEEE